MFTLFLTFEWEEGERRLSVGEVEHVARLVQSADGVRRAIILTPAEASDRFNPPDPPPGLALQIYFPTIEAAEAAIDAGGALARLNAGEVPFLEGAVATHQLMYCRPYLTPPAGAGTDAAHTCAYMVHYVGRPDDLNSWLDHYLRCHLPVMKKFPGLLELEMCTRVDWIADAPWGRADHFQRNKVVFASPAALGDALNSPVRDELRADFHAFPRFEGHAVHVPMLAREIDVAPLSMGF